MRLYDHGHVYTVRIVDIVTQREGFIADGIFLERVDGYRYDGVLDPSVERGDRGLFLSIDLILHERVFLLPSH